MYTSEERENQRTQGKYIMYALRRVKKIIHVDEITQIDD